MNWVKQVQQRLFPVSVERVILSNALKEWGYYGTTFDLEDRRTDCELCGHPDIRYQFEIINRHNNNQLLVGSECITKFGDIGVFDGNKRINDHDDARRKVARDRGQLITEAHLKAVINSLITLARADREFGKEAIDGFITYYQEHRAFTPRKLSTILWRLTKHQVEFKPQYLKMTIKKKVERDQLLSMEDWQIERLYRSLSSSQKHFLVVHRPEFFQHRHFK